MTNYQSGLPCSGRNERMWELKAKAAGWSFDEITNEYRLNNHGEGYEAIDANKTWKELCKFHGIA